MAITTEDSTEVSRVETNGSDLLDTTSWEGKLRYFHFTFTQGAAAGDAGSIQRLVNLPPGRWRILLALSRVSVSALGAARTMDIGWEAYVNADGDAVVADPNGLDDGTDVSSAVAFNPIGTVGDDETMLVNSRSKRGITLTSQVNDGTIPAAATVNGYFVAVAG